jgi:hypothetical protein
VFFLNEVLLAQYEVSFGYEVKFAHHVRSTLHSDATSYRISDTSLACKGKFH